MEARNRREAWRCQWSFWHIEKAKKYINTNIKTTQGSGPNQPPVHRDTSRCSQWPVRAWLMSSVGVSKGMWMLALMGCRPWVCAECVCVVWNDYRRAGIRVLGSLKGCHPHCLICIWGCLEMTKACHHPLVFVIFHQNVISIQDWLYSALKRLLFTTQAISDG